jgi:hypothetical protein
MLQKFLVSMITAFVLMSCSCKNLSSRELEILSLVRPVKIKDCDLKRFGSSSDGGYLACAKKLKDVEAVYSYGIEGRDEFGCEIALKSGSTVHQYDPFDLTVPKCKGASSKFHAVGIAGKRFTDSQKREFDTFSAHVSANGDRGKKLFLKMDVEGSEWESLLNTPDELLKECQQIVIEFHGLLETNPAILPIFSKLKKLFYVAHVHANNCCCVSDRILPSSVIEVTYVNKEIFHPEDEDSIPLLPNSQDEKNGQRADCPFKKEQFQQYG